MKLHRSSNIIIQMICLSSITQRQHRDRMLYEKIKKHYEIYENGKKGK